MNSKKKTRKVKKEKLVSSKKYHAEVKVVQFYPRQQYLQALYCICMFCTFLQQ